MSVAEAKPEEKDLLAGTKPEGDAKPENEETPPAEGEEGADEGEKGDVEQGAEGDKPLDLKEAVSTIREAVEEKTEKIAEMREENVFLSKQIAEPDVKQFEKGGIYEDLPVYWLGNKLLYLASQAEIDTAIQSIDNAETLTAGEKRQRVNAIEKAIAVYQDRQNRFEKQVDQNLSAVNQHEWQQVELGFTDPETGIKGIKEHVPAIWKWCQEQMNGSRALHAKCESSFQAKFDLAVKAIRTLGIDKKLGKDLSGKDRPGLAVPVGNAGSQGTKRGSGNAETFTRAQLQEFLKNPAKVDEKLMARINKAMAEGRIRDK